MHDDIRAGVAAGIIDEAQAARLLALAHERQGKRDLLPADEEPFELFRGFSEIFISVGLIMLITGIIGASVLTSSMLFSGLLGVAMCYVFARYFTIKRRMVLPSIVLTVGFGMALSPIFLLIGEAVFVDANGPAIPVILGAMMIASYAVWYRLFKIPFTMFMVGLAAAGIVLAISAVFTDSASWWDFQNTFDLRNGSGLAFGTLLLGFGLLIAGLWFDMRDPHRIGRSSASAFWLHLLAAPALVNTVGMTFMKMDNAAGFILLAITMLIVTLLALIIDRRSFLTAGLTYFGFLIGTLVYREGDWFFGSGWMLIIMGSFVTLTGAKWTVWRSWLLRTLPDFPLKDRLPPY